MQEFSDGTIPLSDLFLLLSLFLGGQWIEGEGAQALSKSVWEQFGADYLRLGQLDHDQDYDFTESVYYFLLPLFPLSFEWHRERGDNVELFSALSFSIYVGPFIKTRINGITNPYERIHEPA